MRHSPAGISQKTNLFSPSRKPSSKPFFPGPLNVPKTYPGDVHLQFCPKCGSAIDPDKKFCTNCGASLTPDLPGDGTGASTTLAAPAGLPLTLAIIGVVVLAIIVLGIVFVVYPMLTGSGIFAAGNETAASPTAEPTHGSYVEIVTPDTPRTYPPTEVPVVTTTTPVPTTIAPTTPQVTKAVICPMDKIPCNNQCVDIRTDSKNCGYCGTACPSGKYCLNGICVLTCSAGQTSCPGGCFNLQTDADHCGTCNNNCPAGLLCKEGECRSPLTPMPVPV